MIKGIFTSASGMLPQIRKQELSANNLANASTSGFKKDSLFTRELSRAERRVAPVRSDWEKPMIDHVYTDFAPGVFDYTGNPLDMAIEGDGFFVLQTPEGETVLTRSGAFTVNSNGQLVFPGGALVMSEGGPIEVGDGQLQVSASGEIQSDGLTVGRIQPRTAPDLSLLEKIGGSTFVVPPEVELVNVDKASIRQGYLEAANVDIVGEMVSMITSFRAYEANAKAIQSQDSSLESLFNRVAGRN